MSRLVAARRHLRDWNIPDMPPLALDGGQAAATAVTDATARDIAGMRDRPASITQTAAPAASPPPARQAPAIQVPPAILLGIPPQIGQTLLALLAAPGGTSASEAGLAIGKSKTVALEYLGLLRDRGIATTVGGGQATRWHRAAPAPPGPAPGDSPSPPAYVTVEALADMVHDGLVHVDDDTRAVPEQAREIRDRQRAARPRLTVVRPPEDAAGDGT
jgi:hypothetical protein